MNRTDALYQSFLEILREELVPAMGCTEPIAIAYAAAVLRQTLGGLPERMRVAVSGNILKNAKSVVVPGTGGAKGIAAAAAAGAVAGDASRLLEVIDSITPEQREQVQAILGGVEQTRTYLGRIRAEVQTPLKYKTKKNDKTCRIVEN